VVGLRITAADVEGSIAAALNSMQVTGNQTVEGTKTFNGPIIANGGVQGNVTGNVSGNAGTVTNGVYTTGNQTIGGNKTFSGDVTVASRVLMGNVTSPNTATLQWGDNTGWTFRMMTDVSGTPTLRYSFTDTGNFTATGNVTANGQFIGNGAGLTNVNATNVTGTAGQLGYSVNSTIGFGGRGGPEVTGHGGGAAAMMSFHRPGHFAVNFGLDGNDIAVGGWSFGNVSRRILHEGNWRGIIGAANVGEVGTYAFLRPNNETDYGPGATLAGSSLRYSGGLTSAWVSGSAITAALDGAAPAGTWRCMGNRVARDPDPNGQFIWPSSRVSTLWLRIS